MTKMFAQFGQIKPDIAEGIKNYISRYSSQDLDVLWKRFDGFYDSDRIPNTGSLRKIASDAGLSQSQSEGSISKWLVRCQYCDMVSKDGQQPCPHCRLHSLFTIIPNHDDPEYFNQGRRLSIEDRKMLHFAYPHLICAETREQKAARKEGDIEPRPNYVNQVEL